MQGKVIVITGATGALGSLTAKTFAEMGASLALFGNNQSKLDVLVKDLNLPENRLLTQVADLREADSVLTSIEAVSTKFGGVHALIHLIGGWTGGKTIPDSSADDLGAMLGQHVWTTFHLFQALSPKLAASKWGRVIIVSASTVPNPPGKTAIYTAVKAAQENMTLSLAAELKQAGVTANIIQVHSIDVKGVGKGTKPDEIVSAMQYLFSDQAGKVTGARIPLY
jgi:NAD(P)-dependent dehydrogenase (short-subunit alcohol dehydrogenase family)